MAQPQVRDIIGINKLSFTVKGLPFYSDDNLESEAVFMSKYGKQFDALFSRITDAVKVQKITLNQGNFFIKIVQPVQTVITDYVPRIKVRTNEKPSAKKGESK